MSNFIDLDEEESKMHRFSKQKINKRKLYFLLALFAIVLGAFFASVANAGEMKKCEDNPDATKMACDVFDQKTWDKHKAETDMLLKGASNVLKFEHEKFYINLGGENIEVKHPNGFRMDADNFVGRLGYQLNDNWAFEYEISKAKDGYFMNNNAPANYKWSDMGVFVKYDFLPDEKFKPFARVGVVQMKEKGSQPDLYGWGTDVVLIEGWNWSSSDQSLALGVGAEFEVTKKFGIRWDTSWIDRERTDLRGNKSSGDNRHIKTGLTGVYRF